MLASSGQALFHSNDLAQLLDIHNPNTLRVTLHRLVQAGILHRIHRGLLSLLPVEKIDPVLLGSACLHRSSYCTTESVLRREGYILQSVDAITFASDVSRKFTVRGQRYISRQLHARFLYNQEGIHNIGGVFWASAERAIADMLYFDPWYHFDKPVNWKRVSRLQKEIGYPRTPHRYPHIHHLHSHRSHGALKTSMHMSPRLCWVSGERTPEKVYITRVFCYGSWEEWKDMLKSFPKKAIEDAVRSPLRGSWTPQGKAFAETLFGVTMPDNTIITYLPSDDDSHRDLA